MFRFGSNRLVETVKHSKTCIKHYKICIISVKTGLTGTIRYFSSIPPLQCIQVVCSVVDTLYVRCLQCG